MTISLIPSWCPRFARRVTRTLGLAVGLGVLLLSSPALELPGGQHAGVHSTTARAQGAPKRPAAQATRALLGVWRVERGTVAPWVGTDDAVRKATSPTELLGARVQFLPTRVDGAAALRCGNARYTATNVPAGGLFQGNLPAPASRAAAEIGLRESAIRGISLTCDRGLFEFHVADQTTVLVALDNVIWTLSRAAGALADSVSPAGVVQRLLEQHFASGLAFDSANVLSKSAFLSDSLRVSSLRYLAIPPSPDEAPVIDGDPFTYTQEYPTRFAVGAASVRGTLASVPVRFADAYSQRVLTYRLQRTAGTWRVADVRYADGSMLGMLRDERP